MSRKTLAQTSFFTPEFADPKCIPPGSLPWLLHHHGERLTPSWLFGDWRGSGRVGRNAWPARVLVAAMVLRWHEGGMSRRGMARRLSTDVAWRAAALLEIGADSPGESVFRRFERFLLARDSETCTPRFLLLHELIVRLCMEGAIVSDRAVWAIDSTPMWCFGAVRGTVRLLGDGVRGLCLMWAKATKTPLDELATEWTVPWLVTKSTKGSFSINWRDPSARAGVVETIARTAVRVVATVRRNLKKVRSSTRKRLLRRCRRLLRVIAADLEADDAGHLSVARGVAKDRVVSITDGQARHSRKTKSRPFNGYRLHVVGDVVSGLIASVTVTPANMGDGRPAHRLIRRAKNLFLSISRMLGDQAYAGVALHEDVEKLEGVDLLAPRPPPPARKGSIAGSEFQIDLANNTATCPNGVMTQLRAGTKHRYFRWNSKDCAACPLRPKCFSEKATSRAIVLHAKHEELRALREQWQNPEIQAAYRTRSQCERLVRAVVRRGCRQARAWGLQQATLQAHSAVMSNNLALLAQAMSVKHEQSCRMAA